MNPLPHEFSTLVQGWTPVLDILARATVLLAITGIASLALRRASAATRHLLWTLGLASALVIPLLAVALPRFEVPIVTIESPSAPAWSAPQQVGANAGLGEAPAAPTRARAATATTVISEAVPVSGSGRARTLPWATLLLGVWAAGALVVAGRLVLGHLLVRWMFRRAEPLNDAAWLPLAGELAKDMGISGPVRFRRSPRATMPMACGLLRPIVLMPADADEWPVDRLRIVLLHELAHVKRRDCLTHAVAQVACAAYWFNPLVWIAARHLRAERERACDDLVLAAGTRGSDYAELLLEIARVMRAGRMPAIVTGAGLAMAHRSQLEGRLMAILDPTVPRTGPSRRRAAATTTMVALALVGIAAVQPWAYADISDTVNQTGPVPHPVPEPVVTGVPEALLAADARQPAPRPAPAPSTPRRPSAPAVTDSQDVVEAVAASIAAAAVDSLASGALRGAIEGSLEAAAAGVARQASQSKPAAAPKQEERAKVDPRTIAALTAALEDVDKQVREAAMHALVQLRDPAAFEPLVRALKDAAADIREHAAHSLGQFRDRRAVGPLSDALKDQNPGVREQAAFALGQLRDPSVVPALTAALKDANAGVREQAVFALGQLRDASATEALAVALRDESADVREQAAFALGQVRDRRAVEPLVSALKDADADVREQAAFALGQLREKGAVEALVFALRDETAKVREQAAFALGQLRDPRAIEGLTAALKDPSAKVREQAAFALGQLAR